MAFRPRKRKSIGGADRFARARANAVHVCMSCTHSQPSTFRDCPICKAPEDLRVYFPSHAEHVRGAQLIRWQAEGKISRLEFHPRIDLVVEGTKLCTYEADSYYMLGDKQIYEDVKPKGDAIEPASALKIALFNALNKKHGLEVLIYRSP